MCRHNHLGANLQTFIMRKQIYRQISTKNTWKKYEKCGKNDLTSNFSLLATANTCKKTAVQVQYMRQTVPAETHISGIIDKSFLSL